MPRLALLLLFTLPACAQLSFETQEIAKDFGVGMAVTTADVNSDGKTDVLVINPKNVVWFENPTWRQHVVHTDDSKGGNVAFAPHDIDGDGRLDLALGADWQATNTQGAGTLQWIGPDAGRPEQPWRHIALGSEPTTHRMRWGDVIGDQRPELIVAPLHGRGTKAPDWEGPGARILVYSMPADPAKDKWRVEVADDSQHIVHNIEIANINPDLQQEILTASKEGVFLLHRETGGKWTKNKLAEGSPGEIRLGKVGNSRYLATIEPWHGNKLVLYEEQPGLWRREVVDETLTEGHALAWADFDGDGADEIAVGWRKPPFGVAIYDRDAEGKWKRTAMLDEGGMATEDLAVADLDGNGRPDLIASGRATQNVRIYWNRTKPKWKRHVVSQGFFNQTAIAADFTGDGKPDVIANSPREKKTYLFAAPNWEKRLLNDSTEAIHSEVFDVDGDGDMDYIGARYQPGLVFWLEQPKNPMRDPWPFHIVDDVKLGGVNGIHGLIRGDIDKDGKPDLIANSAQPKGSFPNSIAWLKAPKNPRTAKHWERHIFAQGDAPGLSHYMGVGDINGDGLPDIASAAKVADKGNWFAWWEQPANGKEPWRKHLIAEGHEGATNIHPADVNGDGKVDFVASRGHGRGLLWFEAPDWKPHVINDLLVGPHSLAVADIDKDGDLDVVTCAKDSYIAAWFENDGKGHFTTHHIYENQAAYDIRLVDMDLDTDLDVLIAGQNSENVVWYENPGHSR